MKFVNLHLKQPRSKLLPPLILSNRSGYQMFSQELLTNGELNHFSLKERMVEIGKRWHKLSQSQKDKYKKLVEEQQVEYKAELEAWVKVTCCSTLSPRQQQRSGEQHQFSERKSDRQPQYHKNQVMIL